MKLLIHDLEINEFEKAFFNLSDEVKVVSKDSMIHHCIGCFGCWVKTPARCVIRDKYSDMGEYLSKCRNFIIISRCCYGGYSPFVKNILDRSISYLHPYFVMKNGEMHHRRRYDNRMDMKVWFYGEDITEKEKCTAQKLVRANSINLACSANEVTFIHDINEMKGQIL
ncbi:flavodoxin family protein [Clostridium sp. LBM24168]